MTTAAVVGCGDISVVHLQAISEIDGVDLVGVCDVDLTTAAVAAERYGVPSFADHGELLRDLRPDVVHVCTPHDQHAPVALDSLAAGTHVLLEKPLAHRRAAAEQIAEAAARHPELKVGVCFQNRYNPTTLAIRQLLDSGTLGAVLGGSASVLWRRTAEYYRSRPWRGEQARSGGGVLINQAIHTVDLMQWLLGEVTSVHGDIGHYGAHTPDIDVEDTAHLVLEHQSGVRTLFYASTLNVDDAPITIDIATEQALLHLEGNLTVTYADGRVETVLDAPAAATIGRSYWGTSHRLLIEDFYRHLPEPTPFWIDPAEALKTSRILAQVYAE
jgi:UDP-N-acetyl-2-amino-2-deoxyglucuronate dehydrogenase